MLRIFTSPFFSLANLLPKKTKIKIKILKKKWFLEVFSCQKWEKNENVHIRIFGLSLCSQKCRRMIKDLYFSSQLLPYLDKSSWDGPHFRTSSCGWSPDWLQTKIPEKNIDSLWYHCNSWWTRNIHTILSFNISKII
jgi:hypothetical protein